MLAEILGLPQEMGLPASLEEPVRAYISGDKVSHEAGARAVAALRDEVDFGLAIAVGRDTAGRRGDRGARAYHLTIR